MCFVAGAQVAGTNIGTMADFAAVNYREYEHLQSVDAQSWPGIATVPSGRGVRMRERRVEAAFARACSNAGIELNGAEPDIVIEHAALFTRIAASGWVGLAEGFMAGEWRARDSHTLVDVLSALISHNYAPHTPSTTPKRGADSDAYTGDIPADLVAHFAGDGMSAFQGHFATGVPTTQRERVKSQAKGAGKAGQPTHYFVDVTEFGAPQDAQRADLGDAQRRSVEMLLGFAGVAAGTHLLEFPAGGGALALRAAALRATVDAAANDVGVQQAMEERLVFEGAAGGAHIELIDASVPDAPERFADRRRGVYDVVVGMERLETLTDADKVRYLNAAATMLAPGGRVGLQTVLRTEAFNRTAEAALESLRAYIWPGLSYSSQEQLAKMVGRDTQLRIVARTHAPEHLAESLRLQRMTFDAHLRDAAADGYDIVFRRLWVWQFALREALARLGMLDVSQVLLSPRNRRGRR